MSSYNYLSIIYPFIQLLGYQSIYSLSLPPFIDRPFTRFMLREPNLEMVESFQERLLLQKLLAFLKLNRLESKENASGLI